MSRLALFLLGPPRIEVDGRPLVVNRRKAMALLIYLAMTGQGHSRDALATLLWPEYDQTRARAVLRRTLSVLNKTVAGAWLDAGREVIDLKRETNLWLDVAQFQQRVAACQPDGHPTAELCPDCLPSLAEAVALYRDDFLAGFSLRDSPGFDEWQFFQTESLRRQVAGALEWLVRCHSSQADYDAAIDYARRWLGLDPWHEPAHRHLMTLYAQTGQRPAAVRQYQECIRILDEELGLAPSQETTALYQLIRAGGWPAAGTATPAAQAPENPPFANQAKAAEMERRLFVAREPELAQLRGYLEEALAGRGQVVFVTGEAGTGKTALVDEFTRQAQNMAAELVVAAGNCNAHTGLGDPYLPFREILGLLTGDVETRWLRGMISRENANRLWALLPLSLQILGELGPNLVNTFVSGASLLARAPALASGSPWLRQLAKHEAGDNGAASVAQSDLFEQYTNVLLALARQRPLLLVIDDAQWADVASINLLFHVGRQLATSRILLVVTFRPDDLAVGRPSMPLTGSGYGERHPLEPVINELNRIYGDVRVDLDQALSQDFVEAWLDTQPNQLGLEFRLALYHQTQGHPLFTVELLQDMQERGDIIRNEQGRWVKGPALNWKMLPARVEAVIKERIGRLEQGLRDLLAVASVEGEEFTAQVLARVQQINERSLLRQLSQELAGRHRLIQEQGEVQVGRQFLSRYRFAHAIFQQYLYNSLGAGERRLLHGEIAAALEGLYQDQAGQITTRLARHYTQAGRGEKAVGYLLQAGDRARSLYAHQEAIEFYQQALAFLREQGAFERAARTLMKLGLTHHLAFNFPQARQAYREGFGLWQRAGANQTGPPSPAPHPLRISRPSPLTLDQAKAGDDSSITIIDQLFSGLVELNPDMDVVPEIARSWEVLEGGSKYIFHLRDDVCWSDGVPVTTEDFVYAWKRVLHPATQSPNASYLFDIKGARAYYQGELSSADQIGVRALDPLTLLVELEGPTGYFPQLLTRAMLYPVPRHVVAAHGEAWTGIEHLVTNGPFLLKEWHQGRSMILEGNPTYRGRFSGNINQVQVRLQVSAAERLKMYEADQLDITTLWPAPSIEAEYILRRYPEEYLPGPALRTQYLGFDISQPPFDDVRVRRALAMAIDKEHLASVILSGQAFPGMGGFVPPGMPGHAPSIGLPFAPEQARRLLAEAGYPGGRHFPRVEYMIGEDNEVIGDYLQTQWQETLGLEITWQIIEWPALFDRIAQTPLPLFMIGWSADYPDPDNFLRVSASTRGFIRWRNSTFSALVEQARRVTNQAERLEMYQQADKILVEEAAIIPLIYGRQHMLVKPWVSKFPTSAINTNFWKDIVIEPH